MTCSRTGLRGVAVLAGALATALLTGCLKLDTELTLSGDTVDGSLVAALAADDVAPLGITPEEIFADQDAGLGGVAGVTSEPYQEDRWTGVRYLLNGVALDELNAVSEGDPDGLRIQRDPRAGTYEFQMVIDLQFTADYEPGLDEPGAPEVDLAQLQEGFEVAVTVTFPGSVIEHNGDLAGTTVSWQPPAGERSELRALAEDGGEPPPAGGARSAEATPEASGGVAGSGASSRWWMLGLALLAALLTGGLATALVRRWQRGSAAAGDPR